jgi:hypothetical protein
MDNQIEIKGKIPLIEPTVRRADWNKGKNPFKWACSEVK